MSLSVKQPLSVWWDAIISEEELRKSVAFLVESDNWFFECGEDSAGIVDLYVCLSSTYVPEVPLFGVSVQVVGNDGRSSEELYQRIDEIVPRGGLSRKFRSRIWSRKISDIERVLPTWQRRLTFRVTFADAGHTRSSNASVQTPPSTNPDPCSESLSADLAKMLLEKVSDPDVKLHCEGRTAKAHKNILSARSPVLAKMLNSQMKEGRTGVVNIEDMTADTFGRFLKYLYTGRLDSLTFESAFCLYETGDMYEVYGLKRLASHSLIANLTVENACQALVVAEAHGDAELEETVTAYVLENDIPLSDDLWSGFCESHPKLAFKVYGHFCKMLSKRK